VKKQSYIKLIILAVLTFLTYIPTFMWMVYRWTAAETYYSHGFLVPLISGFIIWQKKSELGELKIEPVKLGWLFFIFGISIHIISAMFQVYFSSGFSLILILVGLVLLSLGKNCLKQLLFPILFIAFMIPLPMVTIANLSFRLKIFAAQLATFIVNKLGVQAIREGSIIKTLHSSLMVEDPCSGIRSLIALIALGALMAYFSHLSKIKKTILLLSSLPIAILANVIRIVALTFVSDIYGTKVATGTFHNIMGILVFVFAFIGLSLIQHLLKERQNE
jgi:exosortase